MLAAYVEADQPVLVTSRVALVEVARATAIANQSPQVQEEAARLLDSCLLVDVSDALLRSAATLTSRDVRTLDAIHLATAQQVAPDEMLVYDTRLREAARSAGIAVANPGARR